jgi:Sec-independent protein translocase protein TatA
MNSSNIIEETIRVYVSIIGRNGGDIMRMGTFLLGGIVGAVAVVYMNRNNGMSMSNLANAGQTVGNMVNKAKSNFSNMNSNMGMNSNQKTTTDQSNESADFSTVEQIVNKDPELKNKVDEILADGKQNTSEYRMQ